MLASCSKSMVYSPSINLPNEILKEEEFDFQAGFEAMPEARPEKLKGSQTTIGLNGQIGYGINDKFNMSAKVWLELKQREGSVRSGLSLNWQFISVLDENKRIIILPRIGISESGFFDFGYGIGSSAIYHHSLNGKIGYYAGIGGVWGFLHLHKDLNDNGEKKIPMGFGVLGNIGLSWEMIYGIRLNFEINPIYQINTFDEIEQVIFSPQIGVGYKIKR